MLQSRPPKGPGDSPSPPQKKQTRPKSSSTSLPSSSSPLMPGPRMGEPPQVKPGAKGQSAQATARTQVQRRKKAASSETFSGNAENSCKLPRKPHARKKRRKSSATANSENVPVLVEERRKSLQTQGMRRVAERRVRREMLWTRGFLREMAKKAKVRKM